MASRSFCRLLSRPKQFISAPFGKTTYRPLPSTRGIRYQRFGGSNGRSDSRFEGTVSPLKRWAAHPNFYLHVISIGGVVGVVYISNLETVEVSGRRRFNIVSDDYVKSMATEQERLVLREYAGNVLPPHDERSKRVARILERLKPHATGIDGLDWTVRVIDSDEANAFVLPGNKVFIFTEMLDIAGSDDGIAAVLGHEIGHTVAKHMAERLSQSVFLTAGSFLSAYLLGVCLDILKRRQVTMTNTAQFDVGFTNVLLSLVFERPGSRAQESEADYIGLLMMAAACYDPEAAVQLWARMQRENPGETPQFLSTHPSSANREKTIESWLPEARIKMEASECHLTQYTYGQFRDFGQRWGSM